MNESITKPAFFEKDSQNPAIYHPTIHARGPWDPNSLHGRVISGLIAYEAETNHCNPAELYEMQTARITVDLFRLPPMAPLIVHGEIIRSGRRIKVVDVHITTNQPDGGEKTIARGNVVMLRKSQNPPGEIWSPSGWDLKAPEENLPTLNETHTTSATNIHLPTWETKDVNEDSSIGVTEIDGRGCTPIRRRAWIRETHNLIANEPSSPLVRVAQVADVANPFANSGTQGLNFINADVSLYLQRNPVGSWIGTETSYHGADEGISIGNITLYDKLGSIGMSTVCGLAQTPTSTH